VAAQASNVVAVSATGPLGWGPNPAVSVEYGPMAPAQLEAILRASADDLGKPGNDDFHGRGRVDAWAAVR
jgi:hypothetical protein